MTPPADAETVLAVLWASAKAEAAAGGGPERVRRLAQSLGEQAMQCVADSLGRRQEALIRSSADVLGTLVSVWAACGLSPDEIWIELHKREQLGSLLMQLNQAPSRAPRRLLKPWRVDSTKLP